MAAQNYQKLNSELEVILEELQSADLDIDEALKKYERGMVLIGEIEQYLKSAANKVKKIKTDFGQTA